MPSARKLLARSLALLVLLQPLGARADDPDPADPDPDPPLRRLTEVTATATRAERDVLEVPGNVTLIDREEIERSQARSVPELLRRQPGLFVTNFTTNPAGTNVEARGFNNGGSLGSSLLVLVDGRRVNQADTGNTDWALLPIDLVESIEIVRGPASSLYGDNAIGGVLEITTRRPEGPLEFTGIGRAGSYDTHQGSFNARGELGPVGGRLFVSALDTGAYRKGADYDDAVYDGSLRFQLGERATLELSGGYHSDHRELPGALTLAEIDEFGRRAQDPGTENDETRVRERFGQANFEMALMEGAHLEVEAWHRNYRNRTTITTIAFGPATTTGIRGDLTSNGVNARIRFDQEIGPFRNRLVVGGEFLREDGDRDILGAFPDSVENRRKVYAGFLQNEVDLTEKLRLAGGLRYDHADYRIDSVSQGRLRPDHNLWSPKVSLLYRITPAASAYASYARGFRLPNFDEDTPFFGPPPDLDPQKSDSYDLGLKLRSERVSGDLTLYWMRVENEIILDPITFANTNFDRVRHRGVEASLRVALLDWLEAIGSYTFDDTQVRRGPVDFGGSRIPITPRHRGDVALRAALPFGFDGTFRGRWVSNRVLSNDFTSSQATMSKYGVYDLLLGFRPDLHEDVDVALGFAIRNLFGREYFDFGTDFFGQGFFYPAAKRNYELSLIVTLRR